MSRGGLPDHSHVVNSSELGLARFTRFFGLVLRRLQLLNWLPKHFTSFHRS